MRGKISPPFDATIDRGTHRRVGLGKRLAEHSFSAILADADAKFRQAGKTETRPYTHRCMIRSVPDANTRSSLPVLLSNRCMFVIPSNETWVRAGKL